MKKIILLLLSISIYVFAAQSKYYEVRYLSLKDEQNISKIKIDKDKFNNKLIKIIFKNGKKMTQLFSNTNNISFNNKEFVYNKDNSLYSIRIFDFWNNTIEKSYFKQKNLIKNELYFHGKVVKKTLYYSKNMETFIYDNKKIISHRIIDY